MNFIVKERLVQLDHGGKKYIKVVQVMLSFTGKCQEDFLLGVWGRAMHMEHQWYCCKELKKRGFFKITFYFPRKKKWSCGG